MILVTLQFSGTNATLGVLTAAYALKQHTLCIQVRSLDSSGNSGDHNPDLCYPSRQHPLRTQERSPVSFGSSCDVGTELVAVLAYAVLTAEPNWALFTAFVV